ARGEQREDQALPAHERDPREPEREQEAVHPEVPDHGAPEAVGDAEAPREARPHVARRLRTEATRPEHPPGEDREDRADPQGTPRRRRSSTLAETLAHPERGDEADEEHDLPVKESEEEQSEGDVAPRARTRGAVREQTERRQRERDPEPEGVLE